MTELFDDYKINPIPESEQNLAWNLYGAGVDSIGREGAPENFQIPEPAEDQLLVRVDAIGLCFSDVKLIRQGGSHPKLYNRNLEESPTRLGHEAALTVVKVGSTLADRYKVGERYAMQPDIYQNGKSTAYGYTVPGGLIQYHLIGSEILETDAGACLLKISDGLGYAESALLEPWGCVWAAYTQRRRLEPKAGGIMWIIGEPDIQTQYGFSKYLDLPALVILTDVPEHTAALVNSRCSQVVVKNGLTVADYAALVDEYTDKKGFDDVVMLCPKSAEKVSAVAKLIARRGTMNLVGKRQLDGKADVDVGRLHYDYIAFYGNSGNDIADSYGEARNRCDLSAGGTAVFVGAGGPMGQMHVQRAIEKADGPKTVVVTDVADDRLKEIESRFRPLTEKYDRELITYNPLRASETLADLVMEKTKGAGAEDVVVCVPNGDIMADSATFMHKDGMLVLFAGVPNGTMAPVELSDVYLNNAQYTGTSGLTINDQTVVMQNAVQGNIAPAVCVAAIGGMEVAKEGIQAMIDSKYPGKILIFPQLKGLPLVGLDELKEKYPDIGGQLAAGNIWTQEAEQALFNRFLG